MSKLFSAVSLIALATGAAHAEATQQGAADLTAVFQTYLSAMPGVVNVVADGDAYAVTLDATPFIAMMPAEAGVSLTMSPLRMRMSDNGDGTWRVTNNEPVSFSMSAPGMMEMTAGFSGVSCDGTYDTAIKAFSQNACTLDGITMFQRVQDPMSGEQVTDMRADRVTFSSTGVAGAAGGVDIASEYTITNLVQDISQAMAPGEPPLPLTLTLAESRDRGTATGLRSEAVLAALAWVVANPSESAMLTNRLALRDILSGGLPLFERVAATGEGTGLRVDTPVGPFAMETFGYDVALNGAVEAGELHYVLRFGGITPPPGVVPPFAEPLLPKAAVIDLGVDSFDAAAAAQVLLGLFELAPGAEPGPEFEMNLMQAFMPDGSVDVFAGPGSISNDLYTLSWEGRMQAGPNMMVPTGTAKVTAQGYDAAMEALRAAPPEMVQELLPVMGMARGLAVSGPDGSLVWDIDATVPGTLKINGMDLMGMQ